MKPEVILVDEQDRELGVMQKLEAHKKGLLHRAVSVFILNAEGKFLLQRRAMEKYHSPGLWTNTACSHPMPGESTLEASRRRLKEEMGIDCDLHYAFNFIYRAEFDNGLIEHELDHVYVGYGNENPKPDVSEVMDWNWYSEAELKMLLEKNPKLFTEWFKICFESLLKHLKTMNLTLNS